MFLFFSTDKSNLEICLQSKNDELARLQQIMSSSGDVAVLAQLQDSVTKVSTDLEAAIKSVQEKENIIEELQKSKSEVEEALEGIFIFSLSLCVLFFVCHCQSPK